MHKAQVTFDPPTHRRRYMELSSSPGRVILPFFMFFYSVNFILNEHYGTAALGDS